MNDKNLKSELASVDRKLKKAVDELYIEYGLSESPAVARAIQDILDAKAKLDNLH